MSLEALLRLTPYKLSKVRLLFWYNHFKISHAKQGSFAQSPSAMTMRCKIRCVCWRYGSNLVRTLKSVMPSVVVSKMSKSKYGWRSYRRYILLNRRKNCTYIFLDHGSHSNSKRKHTSKSQPSPSRHWKTSPSSSYLSLNCCLEVLQFGAKDRGKQDYGENPYHESNYCWTGEILVKTSILRS